MYSVYLVDDERLVLDDMKKNVPWLEYNMQVVGESQDATIAVGDILKLKPDIVFTDIQMPKLNGFELIQTAKKKGATCDFVVVSAHEKFEYARKIIQLNGFDYLLKPVEEQQYTELLERLLTHIENNALHTERPVTSSEDLNAILQHIGRNVSQKHSLSVLGKQFNINPNYICNLFAKHLQTTFSTYMTKLRMERASQYLLGGTKPVKEIAGECGYDDYFYFCRVFRGYYNCPPSQYRKGNR